MKKWIQKRLRYECSNYKWYRKWVGGYWENWYIDIIHSDMWFDIEEYQADSDWRPGCGFGTPLCEYYDVGYFGSKIHYNPEVKKHCIRQKKLERLCGEN